MVNLTKNEGKALLVLFKELTRYHNANSLSREIGISRVGTMKILKKLEKDGLLMKESIGKSIVYRPNLEDDYARDFVSFLLSNEANNFKRWKDEFKGLFKEDRIVLLYGSTIKDYNKSRDIDIMIIKKARNGKDIYRVLSERQEVLPKKIHEIVITPEEFLNNIRKKQKAMIDIVKSAVILYGQRHYVELIKNVASV